MLGLDNQIGNFKPGKEFDALIIETAGDHSPFDVFPKDTVEDLVQKFIFLGNSCACTSDTTWIISLHPVYMYCSPLNVPPKIAFKPLLSLQVHAVQVVHNNTHVILWVCYGYENYLHLVRNWRKAIQQCR